MFSSAPVESEQLRHWAWHFKLLSFWFITIWQKRWNLANLFGCCTINSTSLSLRFWSLDLIFSGSWWLKVHWARTLWKNFFLTYTTFFVSFSIRSEQFRQIICDCKSEWINAELTKNSRLLTSFRFVCTCKQSPPFLNGAGFSIDSPHCWQTLSWRAMCTEVLL